MTNRLKILLILFFLTVYAYGATRSIVPRADDEGTIGRAAKNWKAIYSLEHYIGAIRTIYYASNELYFNDETSGTQSLADLLGGGSGDLVDDLSPQLGADLDMNGFNIDFPTTPNISDVLDEDAMGSDSATKLVTQQSIKAYSDSATQTLTNKTLDDASNLIHANAIHSQLRNESGTTINVGDAVYISGYNGGLEITLVSLADASDPNKMPAIAILTDSSLANNATGQFSELGKIPNMNTVAWSSGDELWISGTGTTGNTLTNTKPIGTNKVQKVAYVLRDHATLGSIEVVGAGRINDMPNLAEAKIWIGDSDGVPQEITIGKKGFGITIDGGGSAITTGIKGYAEVPYDMEITGVTMLADQSGSIVIDIWIDSYANYPPTDADSITASAVPTISGAVKSQDLTLTGWTLSVSAGDIVGFNVDSAATIERVTLNVKGDRA